MPVVKFFFIIVPKILNVVSNRNGKFIIYEKTKFFFSKLGPSDFNISSKT